MARRDLLHQLVDVAVDLHPEPVSRAITAQLSAMCETTRVVFGAAAVSVAVVDVGLRYVAASGAGADEIVGVHLPIERGLAGYVAITGQALAIDRPADDPRFARDVAESTGFVPATMLIVPITDRTGDVIGVLSVLDRSIGTADALAIASSFADQAALVLPDAQRTALEARVLLAAVVDAVREHDDGLASALERAVDRLPEPDADMATIAAMLLRLHMADERTRTRVTALLAEIVDLVTAKRRR